MKMFFSYSGSEKSHILYKNLIKKYGHSSMEEADVIVSIGGDGHLLDILHSNKNNKPIYGLNGGTVGFLLNESNIENLEEKIKNSKHIRINPIKAVATDYYGNKNTFYGYNDVYLHRETKQASSISLNVKTDSNSFVINSMAGDGIIFSTQIGSTAYNRSAGGSIVPLSSNILPLTSINSFKPRWKGALIPDNSIVTFDIDSQNGKRPVGLYADQNQMSNVKHVVCYLDKEISRTLLFSESCLNNKILIEQFDC